MQILVLAAAGLIAAVIVFATNWLALIPWRQARDQHWSERARVFAPARSAAVSNLWVVPAILSLISLLLPSEFSAHWAAVLFVAVVGAIAGTIPMDRETFPRVSWPDLLRQVSVGWLFRFLNWFVFLTAATLMPDEFNIQAVIIATVVVVIGVVANFGGMRLGWKFGILIPPPERLQKIVQETATRMNVSIKEVCLVRMSWAQAFAVPRTRRLIFTERLLEILSDDEITAICAHELAHLTETRTDYYQRYVVWFMVMPWIFFKPMVGMFGMMGFFLLTLPTMLVPVIYRKMSHRLETRADQIAQANEPESGTYARALLRLYEDSLLPVVNAAKRDTHPHLYDRLLAAGLTPDFPRPSPPRLTTWLGYLLSIVMGLLIAVLLLDKANLLH